MQAGLWIILTLAAVMVLVSVGLGAAGVLHLLGVSPWLLALAAVAALVVAGVPWWLTRRGSDWTAFVRRLLWQRHEGQHHAFAGITLRIEDDGRYLWIDGEGLMRATGQREPEPALAARHAGHWRRDERGTLLLRVDSVVKQLDVGRGRGDPRILKFKHYLERDVLFPAAQRRRRAAQG